jgi:hypothetical protein
VNDLLIQLRVQVKNLKSQVGELEKYEQQLTQMNGTPAARDALKDIIKVRTEKGVKEKVLVYRLVFSLPPVHYP